MRSATSVEMTNKTAITILVVKSVFSNPRFVWKPLLKLSPNAPPRPAADCCSKITAISKTESPIWTKGNMEARDDIVNYKNSIVGEKMQAQVKI